mmetsp:Transcript_17801/g.58566  ORF Transcript_17801/g.58566 Transcript_17801/m.58566 type:complete len:218 (+) Transcript_17801:576-1229(+)
MSEPPVSALLLARVVREVHGPSKNLDYFRLIPVVSQLQGCPPLPVNAPLASSKFQEGENCPGVTIRRGPVERSEACSVGSVHLSSQLNELLDGWHVAAPRCKVQGRLEIVVPALNVCSEVSEELDDLGVSSLRRPVHRSFASLGWVARVDIGPVRHRLLEVQDLSEPSSLAEAEAQPGPLPLYHLVIEAETELIPSGEQVLHCGARVDGLFSQHPQS